MNKYISELELFSDAEQKLFFNLFIEKKYSKNEYFTKAGVYSTKLGFISSGIVRAFYRNDEGSEYNKTFFTSSNFIAAYSSLITNQKGLINFQCLTDCTIYIADYSKVVALYDSHPMIERLSRMLAEQIFVSKEKREIELVTMDASERYRIFQEEHPGLENKIPQYHIASYLGVSPTQLSRIRGKRGV